MDAHVASELFSRRNWYRLWFQKAAKALGRPRETAPELEADTNRRKALALEGLWAQNHTVEDLQKELETIRRTRGVLHRGGAVTLIEDDEDALVLGMMPSQKLKAAVADMQRLIKTAVGLGLAEDPAVIAFRARYPENG